MAVLRRNRNDRSASKASDRRARRVRGMSAVPPIASELVRCSNSTKSAITGPVQCSKKHVLLDHLVGSQQDRGRQLDADRFGGLQFTAVSNSSAAR